MRIKRLHDDLAKLGLRLEEGAGLVSHVLILLRIGELLINHHNTLEKAIRIQAKYLTSLGLEKMPAYLTDPSFRGSVLTILDHFKQFQVFGQCEEENPYERHAAFLEEYLPGYIANPEETLNILSGYFSPFSIELYGLYKILECTTSFQEYEQEYGQKVSMTEEDYMGLRYAAEGYNLSRTFFTINRKVMEICEYLDQTFLPTEERLRMIRRINRDRNKFQSTDIAFPASYASKLLYDDPNTVHMQRIAPQIEAIVKAFPPRTKLSQFHERIVRGGQGRVNIAPECGFVLPFAQSLAGDGSILVVHALPSIVENWDANELQTAHFTTNSKQGLAMMGTAFPGRSFLKPEEIPEIENLAAVILMGGGQTEAEITQWVEMLISLPQIPRMVAALSDAQFHRLCKTLPEPYGLAKLCILPTEMFQGADKKRVLAVFEPSSPEAAAVWKASYFRDKKRGKSYIMAEGTPMIAIPQSEFTGKQLPRPIFRKHLKAAEERKLAAAQGLTTNTKTRQSAQPISVTPELTVYCQSSSNAKGSQNIKLYLKSHSAFAEDVAGVKHSGNHLLPDSAIWKKNIQEADIPRWIFTKGVFDPRIWKPAVEQIRQFRKGRRLTLKTLYYCLWDRLQASSEKTKALLRAALWDGPMGELTIGSFSAEDCNGHFQAVGETPAEVTRLNSAFQELLEEGFQKKLISSGDALPLIREFVKKVQNERSVYELRKKNYTAEEEQKIMDYLLGPGKKVLGAALALGVLIMLLTGLPASIVAALCWGDFAKSPLSGYYQLLIYKKSGNDELNYFRGSKCRRIPIMSFLAQQMERYQEWRLKHTSDQLHFDQHRILQKEGKPVSARQLTQAYHKAEQAADIPEELVTLPDNQKTVDFSQYCGSRARENFINHCISECGMNDAEAAFLTMNQLPDTLNRNYVDQHFECRQECMSQKLDRWGRRYSYPVQEAKKAEIIDRTTRFHVVPGKAQDAEAILELELDGDAVITFDPAHGCSFRIMVLEEGL